MGDMKVRIAMAGRFIVDVFLFCLLCFRVLQGVHGSWKLKMAAAPSLGPV
jgi:hypothetical protein